MKTQNLLHLISLFIIFFVGISGNISAAIESQKVVYSNEHGALYGYLCVPAGNGPFPAVLYNHGGMGNKIGGPPVATCEEFAKNGYVGFSPIRRQTMSMKGHLGDVFAAVDYVHKLDWVDTNRIAMMGFSRGGLLTIKALIDTQEFKAGIIMASAPGKGQFEKLLKRVESISAPVLLLVASNDTNQTNHVENMKRLKSALDSAGKESKLIVYPPYHNDGHRMFFEIGPYWSDIIAFLEKYL